MNSMHRTKKQQLGKVSKKKEEKTFYRPSLSFPSVSLNIDS
jgi:hypothetical protein